jgi:hypothetical protein
MDEQRVEAVWGLACFQGWDGERWTEAEMAPIVAALRDANEAARRSFGIRSSEPKGLEVGWDFSKRDGTSGPRFWTRKWTWQSGSWGDETPEGIAARLRKHYDWCLQPVEAS